MALLLQKLYSNVFRCVILFFICCLRFLTIIPLEVPAGLTDTTIKVLNIGVTQYNFLWFVSAWPSTVLSVIGGLLSDKVFGLRMGLLIFVCMVLFGQVMWALGTFLNLFWLMLVGRFFIGAGYNPLTIASHGLKAVWFQDLLSTAMTFDSAFAGLGDTVAFVLPQFLYDQFTFIGNPLYRLGTILSLVAVGVLVSVIITIVIMIMDWRAKDHPHRADIKDIQATNCKDLKNFTPLVWLLISTTALYFSLVYSFVAIGQLLFIHRFRLSIELANVANAIVICGAIPLSPIMGFIIDATGFHLFWGAWGIILSLIAQVFVLLGSGHQFMPFVIGTVYSFSIVIANASLRPCIALLVEVNQVATAFGLFKGLHNFILLLLYIMSGLLIDCLGYFMLMLLFIVLSIVSLLMVGLLCVADYTADVSVINVSGKELRERQNDKRIESEPNMQDNKSD